MLKGNVEIIRIVIISIIIIIVTVSALSAQSILVNNKNVAVKGFDVVAYFTQGAAVRGSSEYSSIHAGAEYHFASAEHKALFDADPQAYLPAYGGYCAFAMSSGDIAPIQPRQWIIHNDQLYLNFSAGTQRRFIEDIENMIENADENWPEVRQSLED